MYKNKNVQLHRSICIWALLLWYHKYVCRGRNKILESKHYAPYEQWKSSNPSHLRTQMIAGKREQYINLCISLY